jgi:mRNA interferase RelE/StbE
MMLYNLLIGEEAREQLRSLPKSIRRNIGQRLESLQDGLAGDVKKLTAREHKYRLRVGNYRILFVLEGSTIFIYAVKHRREAYE